MEVQLLGFIGSGLLYAARGMSRTSSPLSADGLALVGMLARVDDPGLKLLLTGAADRICRSWRGLRVPDAVAADHFRCLQPFLSELPAHHDGLRKIFEFHHQSAGVSASSELLANELAGIVVEEARASGFLQRVGLVVPVCLALTEALFATIFEHIETVDGFVPAIIHFACPTSADDESAPGGARRLASVIALRAKSSCPAPLLGSLAAAQCEAGLSQSAIAGALDELSAIAGDLVAILKDAIPQIRDASQARLLDGVVRDLEAGRVTSIEAQLEKAWHVISSQAGAEILPHALYEFQYERARLAEHMLDWELAATHFRSSLRHLNTNDMAKRQETMFSEITALTRLGEARMSPAPYSEAVQVCMRLIALIEEWESPLIWARAHMTAGALLLKLGEIENRADRYAPAALHFKPAIGTLSRINAHDDWGLAQLGLAEALKGLGQVNGDPVLLADAAFSYRAALGAITPEQDRTSWIAAKTGLGMALVRRAVETGDSDELLDAISSLRAARDAGCDSRTASEIEKALGQAYVLYWSETDDSIWLNDGVTLLRRTLASAHGRDLTTEEISLRRTLASSLWSLGEITGDRRLLEEAEVELKRARDDAQTIGSSALVTDAERELVRLQDVTNAMRRPLRHMAAASAPESAKILQFTAG